MTNKLQIFTDYFKSYFRLLIKISHISIISILLSLMPSMLNMNNIKAQKQTDTLHNETKDTASIMRHTPKKAVIMSAIIPGLGQAYNKKYWKIPIIYAGFVGLVYSINFNKAEYSIYQKEYVARLNGDTASFNAAFNYYTEDNLRTLIDFHQRYRDLSYIGVAVLYILNIVDASVDAHLFYFNVGDDLSINLRPSIFYTAHSNRSITGLSLTVKL